MNSGTAVKLCSSLARLRPTAAAVIASHRHLWVHQWRKFRRWQDYDRENKIYKEERRRIENAIRLNDNLYLTPETPSQVLPKKDLADKTRRETGAIPVEFYTKHNQFRYLDHSFDNIRRVHEYTQLQRLQYDQRFIPERTMFLGADLAAAHFLIHRDAAVKFVGQEKWFRSEKRLLTRRMPKELPSLKTPGYYVEAIDASNTSLLYEGFENLYGLEHCRMLSLANCKYINDWALSRLGNMFGDSLEFLDLSNCKRISAKGLLGLRSLKKLRYLRLEGLNHIKNIAKSAIMLEEAIPDLTVIGLDYDAALSKLEEEQKLLADDRVLIDARGNTFVEDDNGRLFYASGNVNERACVCDDDKPLITSTIRRELPAMEEAEFDRLDQLAQGKLRHYLLGSPSGYSWTEQVEVILSFQEKWDRWDAIPTDPKMLPREMRFARLGNGSANPPPTVDAPIDRQRLVNSKAANEKEAVPHGPKPIVHSA